jgi:pimeloyl-ACP methyl ester carboxylesterase
MVPNYFHDRSANAENERICLDMGIDLGARAFENQSLALKHRVAVTDRLGAIQCPTLIIMGEQDKLCSLHDHQTLTDGIAGSQLHIFPNVGIFRQWKRRIRSMI